MPRGRKPKVYPQELVNRVRELYESGFTQVEVGAQLGISQKVVWNLMRRHDVPRRPQIKRDQRGPKNSSWKGGRVRSSAGYWLVLMPDHPRAASTGYVFEHIVVMEKVLGRPLVWHGTGHPESEIVHHLDDDPGNNDPGNLKVTTFCEHLDDHRNEKGQNGGRKCAS